MALPELGIRITGDLNGLNSAITGSTTSLKRFDIYASTVSKNITRNISNINKTNFSGFQASLKAGEVSLGRFAASAQRAVPAISAAGSAVTKSTKDFTGLSRVIQDLPFGFIGIQNNLTQLLPAAGALGLVFSAVVSALTFAQTGLTNWTRGLDENTDATKEAENANKAYSETLRGVSRSQLEGAKSSQEDLTNLRLLFDAYQNANLPLKDRQTAYKQLQSLYPEYFKNIKFEQEASQKTKDLYDQLSASIVASGRARAAANLITKNSERQLDNEGKTADLRIQQEKALEKERKAIALAEANRLAGNGPSSTGANVVNLNAERDLFNARKARLDLDKQIYDLATDSRLLSEENVKLAKDAQNQFVKGGTIVDVSDEAKKNGKSLVDIYEELRKSLAKTEVQFGSTFGERNQAQMSAYQAAIDAATDAFGRQSDAVKNLQKEQRKLFQLSELPESPSAAKATLERDLPRNSKGGLGVLPDLNKRGLPDAVDKETKKAFDNFNNDVSRSVDRFSRKFGETLFTLNEQADQSFQGIFSTLSKELTTALNDVFLNQFTDMLSGVLKDRMQEMDEDEKTAVSAIGLAGGLISGVTKKTNTAGQAIGGALTGGAAGFAVGGPVGAAIGGIVGALGGIFGAKKAREQEKLQQEQLMEEKKQTKLLERQNALAYTSSIIGRMTTQGIVTGVEVNEFGQLTTKVSGNDLSIVLDRANRSRTRGA